MTDAKRHTDAEAWESALTNAPELTKKFSKLRAKVEFLDVRPQMRIAGASDGLQFIVFDVSFSKRDLFRADLAVF